VQSDSLPQSLDEVEWCSVNCDCFASFMVNRFLRLLDLETHCGRSDGVWRRHSRAKHSTDDFCRRQTPPVRLAAGDINLSRFVLKCINSISDIHLHRNFHSEPPARFRIEARRIENSEMGMSRTSLRRPRSDGQSLLSTFRIHTTSTWRSEFAPRACLTFARRASSARFARSFHCSGPFCQLLSPTTTTSRY
jgi:hypothetical protein